MRILMITDFYWPYVGGVEEHVRRLSQALVARGHEIGVVTLHRDGLPERETVEGVRVYRARSTTQRATWLFAHPERPWAPPFPDPAITRELKKIVQLEQPDIVHGHDWLARSYLPLKTSWGARFVMSLHYYTLSCAKKSLMHNLDSCSGPHIIKCEACAANHYGLGKGLLIAPVNRVMAGIESTSVDLFLPVSQATATGNGLKKSDRYRVIPNFMPDGKNFSGDLDPYLSQLPEEKYLLYVGDLRRNKGVDVLLTAYAKLASAPPLVLIGKPWPDSPKEFPKNVFVFMNWPNEAVLAAWERSLFGIVPSIWPEPFGIVVIEAMASGHTVVASQIGGIPEIIHHGESGLLITPGDIDGLQEAIQLLLDNPDLRERMGQAARRQANAFQAAVVVPKIEQIYQELLKKPEDEKKQLKSGKHHYQQL